MGGGEDVRIDFSSLQREWRGKVFIGNNYFLLLHAGGIEKPCLLETCSKKLFNLFLKKQSRTYFKFSNNSGNLMKGS